MPADPAQAGSAALWDQVTEQIGTWTELIRFDREVN